MPAFAQRSILSVLFALAAFLVYSQDIKPYLQTPTHESVWISWKTDSNTETIVEYGLLPDELDFTAIGECQILSDVGYPANYYYHSAQLTGLATDTPYYYRVRTGDEASEIYRFRTQPSPGSGDRFRFLILGDNQVLEEDRYERLVAAARQKAEEKYGEPLEDHIRLMVNVGDQVDVGTLEHYEHLHFAKSAGISPNLPIMTLVGNHETYGSLGLEAYYAHFFYDGITYQGISSGTEDYYAFQLGRVLFVMLSSEHPGPQQLAWLNDMVEAAKTDETVDWIFSLGHRPIQAEQYVGDISPWIRDHVIPKLAETPKTVLHVGGHHHLYARGQHRDFPLYHIISGGTAWDQYWGQSVERDFDDVQKTIDYWAYQIVDIDLDNREMTVECYAIGSPRLGLVFDNELIDVFHRKLDLPAPEQPAVVDEFPQPIELPVAFTSSPYVAPTSELLNSTQFQIASTSDFTNLEIDLIRDFENLYGTTGFPDFAPVDIHADMNILEFTVGADRLPNGGHFIRVRHRDRNAMWSEWSEPVGFTIVNSDYGPPTISTDKIAYNPGEDIIVTYSNGPGNPTDWIGIYRKGDVPGQIASTDWEYVADVSGTVTFNMSQAGEYFIAFFENDGYDEIAPRVEIYVGQIPVLSLDTDQFEAGQTVAVHFENGPGNPLDWIGVYHADNTPGVQPSTQWTYVESGQGTVSFTTCPTAIISPTISSTICTSNRENAYISASGSRQARLIPRTEAKASGFFPTRQTI
jgi:acid phosphatase type 7